jgi:hypothetical protein
MFNDYSVFQMMKLRQEETERASRNAWKYFVNPTKEKKSEKITHQNSNPANPCCQCACV